MNDALTLAPVIAALLLAPLFKGVINRAKALVAGRTGQPLLQGYHDLAKLLGKGAVYSTPTPWVFRAGPVVGCAAAAGMLALTPSAGLPAPVRFTGDLVLWVYLAALGRFFTVLAALDTGSSFEGMGASREVFYGALAELPLVTGLLALAHFTRSLSLSGILGAITPALWASAAPALVLVAAALAVVVLAENARVPVDDPSTHLELTMIHEVMVLDHSGPDLALIEYGAALKLWAFAALLAGVAVPVRTGSPAVDAAAFAGGMALAAVGIGLVESLMARLRLTRVPHLLAGAFIFSLLALLIDAQVLR